MFSSIHEAPAGDEDVPRGEPVDSPPPPLTGAPETDRERVGLIGLLSGFFFAAARSPPDLLRFSILMASERTREEALDVAFDAADGEPDRVPVGIVSGVCNRGKQ